MLISSISVLSYQGIDFKKTIQLNKIMNQIDYINSRGSSKVNVENLKFNELLKIVFKRIIKKANLFLHQKKS